LPRYWRLFFLFLLKSVETTIEFVAPPVPMRQLSTITTNRIE
jgi:hypothetical protein